MRFVSPRSLLRVPSTALIAAVPLLALAQASALEPRNPWLADSTYPTTHAACGQPGSVAVAGLVSTSRALSDAEIAYRFMGPAHLIQVIRADRTRMDAAWSGLSAPTGWSNRTMRASTSSTL